MYFGFETVLLDFFSKSGIINNEERTTHAVAPQLKLSDAVCTARQPSLARVAVVLFAMRFLDDNCHRILSDVKSNSHCTSPPFGRMEQPPARLLFTLRGL